MRSTPPYPRFPQSETLYHSKYEPAGRAAGRVLIAYASRHGSTGEVARAIGRHFIGQKYAVDCRPILTVRGLLGYDSVLLGSAIRDLFWLPEAVSFAQRFRRDLAQLPTALFTVHMLALDDGETSTRQRLRYIDPVLQLFKPWDWAFFPGKIDFRSLGIRERKKSLTIKAPHQDLRDWPRIDRWAEQLVFNFASP
jgi:menaquinone-dependent protoporphyrinogen oxidase